MWYWDTMLSTQVSVEAAHFGAPMLKRRPPGEGARPNRTEIWLFEGVKVDEMDWNYHGRIRSQRQTFSSGIHPPGPLALWASMQKPCVQVKRLLGLVKQQKESNSVTIWQVNKTNRQHSGHLMPTISPCHRSVTCWHTIERRQFRPWSFWLSSDLITLSSSERRQSRSWPFLSSLARARWRRQTWSHSVVVREGSPDCPYRDVPSVIDAFCLHVKLSPCLSLFAASPNLATSWPGHRVFACLLIVPRAWGMNPTGKCLPLGPDCSMKFSANFIHFYPLKKSYFCSVWPGPLSRGLPFEHSSSKMGTLDIELVYSTLCPSITSTHSSSKFCFNTFQYSIGGAIMLDAITYSQDCRSG